MTNVSVACETQHVSVASFCIVCENQNFQVAMEGSSHPASIMQKALKQRLAFDFEQNAVNLAINKSVVSQGLRHYPEHPTLPLRVSLKTEYHSRDHSARKSHLQKTYDLEVEPERMEYPALAP